MDRLDVHHEKEEMNWWQKEKNGPGPCTMVGQRLLAETRQGRVDSVRKIQRMMFYCSHCGRYLTPAFFVLANNHSTLLPDLP